MKGFSNVTSVILAMIVVVMFFTSIFTFFGGTGGLYDQYNKGELNRSILQNYTDITENLTLSLKGTESSWISDIPILGEFFTLAATGWAAIGFIFSMPGLLLQMFTTSVGLLGSGVSLPPIIIASVSAIVWLLLVVALIKVVFKREI